MLLTEITIVLRVHAMIFVETTSCVFLSFITCDQADFSIVLIFSYVDLSLFLVSTFPPIFQLNVSPSETKIEPDRRLKVLVLSIQNPFVFTLVTLP